MRYSGSYTITPDMPQGYIEDTAKRAEQDIVKALLSQLEFGQWYAVKMEHHTEHEGGVYRGVVSLHIDKARTERIVLPSMEEAYLPPAPTVWQRVKNCAAYLRAGMKR